MSTTNKPLIEPEIAVVVSTARALTESERDFQQMMEDVDDDALDALMEDDATDDTP